MQTELIYRGKRTLPVQYHVTGYCLYIYSYFTYFCWVKFTVNLVPVLQGSLLEGQWNEGASYVATAMTSFRYAHTRMSVSLRHR